MVRYRTFVLYAVVCVCSFVRLLDCFFFDCLFSICLFVCLSDCLMVGCLEGWFVCIVVLLLFVCFSLVVFFVCLLACLPTCLSVCLSLSVCLPFYHSVCPSRSLSVWSLSVCLCLVFVISCLYVFLSLVACVRQSGLQCRVSFCSCCETATSRVESMRKAEGCLIETADDNHKQ